MKRALIAILLLPTLSTAQALPGAVTGGINWMENLIVIVNNLIDTHVGVLIGYGGWLLTFVGGLKLALLVMRWGASNFGLTSSAHETPLLAEVYWLFIQIFVCATMLAFYAVPIPGVGLSLHQLPTWVAMQLASEFDTVIVRDFLTNVQLIIQNIHQPASYLNLLGIQLYIGVLINMAILEIAMFTINSVGFVMVGLLTLFGPLFLPLFITKHFAGLFWGWVSELFSYSMYRALAAGLGMIWCSMLVVFFQRSVGGDYSLGNFAILLPTMAMLNFSFVWSMFKIPSIAHRWFGSAGAAGAEFANDLKAVAIGFIAA